MIKIIMMVLLMYPGNLLANGWRLVELREFSMDVWRIGDARQSYYDPKDDGEKWNGGAAANFHLDLFKYNDDGLYWTNRVFTDGTNKQVRLVGWYWKFGIQLGNASVYYEHESVHSQDVSNLNGDNFPLRNVVGLRYVFYKRD